MGKVIDNYLFDKIDDCGGLALYPDGVLDAEDKSTPIVIFARSSIPTIINGLTEKGFSNVKLYSEFL